MSDKKDRIVSLEKHFDFGAEGYTSIGNGTWTVIPNPRWADTLTLKCDANLIHVKKVNYAETILWLYYKGLKEGWIE